MRHQGMWKWRHFHGCTTAMVGSGWTMTLYMTFMSIVEGCSKVEDSHLSKVAEVKDELKKPFQRTVPAMA